MVISSCEISSCGNAIDAQNTTSTFELHSSQITDNSGYPIKTYAQNIVNIDADNTFSNNDREYFFIYGGSINTGTLHKWSYPYYIEHSITVNSGQSLTVDAGCEFDFYDNARLYVYGALVCNGTSSDRITFTKSSDSSNHWGGIYFANTSQYSLLNYVDVTYGGNSLGALIKFTNAGSDIHLNHCRLMHSDDKGIFMENSSDPEIKNTVVTSNNSHGIYISGNCEPTFVSLADDGEWNDFYGNGGYQLYCGTQNLYCYHTYWGGDADGGIYDYFDNSSLGRVYYGTQADSPHESLPKNEHSGHITATSPDDQTHWNIAYGSIHYVKDPVIIESGITVNIDSGITVKFTKDSYIQVYGTLNADGVTFTREQSGAEWQGIRFESGSIGSIQNCTVEYATRITGYGILARQVSSLSISNSILQNNVYGLYIESCSPNLTSNNKFINNSRDGIHITGNSVPQFGGSISEWNDIYGNGRYNLYNGTADLSAAYIYWGSVIESEIDLTIYEASNDSTLGVVDYCPYLDSSHSTQYGANIDAPQNVQISISAGNVNISWDAVSNATSYKIYSSDDPYKNNADWSLEAEVTSTNWSETATGNRKFYVVKAVK